MTPLDPRFVRLQREVGWYVSAAVSIGLCGGSFALLTIRRWPWALLLWTVGSVAVAWLSYLWADIEYRHLGYRTDDDGIEIRSGVYWRAVTSVPRSRVQHIDVSQGPLERKHGLGRLVIYTAGTAHSRVELPGLEHQTALDLRDRLLPRHSADVV